MAPAAPALRASSTTPQMISRSGGGTRLIRSSAFSPRVDPDPAPDPDPADEAAPRPDPDPGLRPVPDPVAGAGSGSLRRGPFNADAHRAAAPLRTRIVPRIAMITAIALRNVSLPPHQ